MARQFEVITECPVHKKPVYMRVSADTSTEAENKVLGLVIDCPWGPINTTGHKFVIGFRAKKQELLGTYEVPYPISPLYGGEVAVSVAPSWTPLPPIKPIPLEHLYYVDADVAERQIKKTEWWSK